MLSNLCFFVDLDVSFHADGTKAIFTCRCCFFPTGFYDLPSKSATPHPRRLFLFFLSFKTDSITKRHFYGLGIPISLMLTIWFWMKHMFFCLVTLKPSFMNPPCPFHVCYSPTKVGQLPNTTKIQENFQKTKPLGRLSPFKFSWLPTTFSGGFNKKKPCNNSHMRNWEIPNPLPWPWERAETRVSLGIGTGRWTGGPVLHHELYGNMECIKGAEFKSYPKKIQHCV